jgi:hypothetical protein
VNLKKQREALLNDIENKRAEVKKDAGAGCCCCYIIIYLFFVLFLLVVERFVKEWADSRVIVNLQDPNSIAAAHKVCDKYAADAETLQKRIDEL